MLPLLFTIFGFLLGALPFSVWVGQWLADKDIRHFGDKNPGATNVLRAGGMAPFMLALVLDISKGAIPVGLAIQIFGIEGWPVVPIALAPPLGHTFSPFLNWRGGKAVAAVFGAWIGLTIWTMPLVGLALLITFAFLLRPHGWAVLATMLGMLFALLLWQNNSVLLGIWVCQAGLLGWNHRADLAIRPSLRRKKSPNQPTI